MLIVNVSLKKSVQVAIKNYGLVKLGPKEYHQIRDTFYLKDIRSMVDVFGDDTLKIMSEAEYDDWLDDINGVGNIIKEEILEELEEVNNEIVDNSNGTLELNNEVLGDLSKEQLDNMLSENSKDDFEFPELDDPNISLDDFDLDEEISEETLELDKRHPFLLKVDNLIIHNKLDDEAKLKAIRKIAENLEIKFDGRATINSLKKEIEKVFEE